MNQRVSALRNIIGSLLWENIEGLAACPISVGLIEPALHKVLPRKSPGV
jgi:hypothetical protein